VHIVSNSIIIIIIIIDRLYNVYLLLGVMSYWVFRNCAQELGLWARRTCVQQMWFLLNVRNFQVIFFLKNLWPH